jgi:hypothetical protein
MINDPITSCFRRGSYLAHLSPGAQVSLFYMYSMVAGGLDVSS